MTIVVAVINLLTLARPSGLYVCWRCVPRCAIDTGFPPSFRPLVLFVTLRETHPGGWNMRGKIAAVVVCAATSLVAASVVAQTENTADSAPGFVNDQRLRAATMPDGNWITFGRDYTNQ